LAAVTVKITLSIAALMTKVEKRLAKYPSKTIISWACVASLWRFGEGARPVGPTAIYMLPWASGTAEYLQTGTPNTCHTNLGLERETATEWYTSPPHPVEEWRK
jgi:hypothetical protein